jgi:beta-galactosidase
MREKFNLNYNWNDNINIPHNLQQVPLNHFGHCLIYKTFKYVKTFNFKKDNNQTYYLKFLGVGQSCKVYLNKHYLGEHLGGYTSFEFCIDSFLDDKNELVVEVSNLDDSFNPFGGSIDYLPFGGIYRETYIESRPKDFIGDFLLEYNDSKLVVKTDKKVSVSVLDDGKEIFSSANNVLDVKGITLWTIDNPYLYTIRLTYLTDVVELKYGFRTIKFIESGFYLNDELIKLRGLNRHQSYPFIGYAASKSLQIDDAIKIKELGCNVVRTSHYPQSHDFLDKCDEIGLLVVTELPGWQHIGDLKWQANALNSLKEMIIDDRNHPCIIMWGVRINESADSHDFYTLTNQTAHELDRRPTGGTRNFKFSELLEDVYVMNDFDLNNTKDCLFPKELVTDSRKGYLITEYLGHMFPTKPFDNPERLTQIALKHYNIIKKVEKSPLIGGALGWCFSDYNTHDNFGAGDNICYHGVCDIYRNQKLSASPYAVYGKEYVLTVSSDFIWGENDAHEPTDAYIFTNTEYVKIYRNDEYLGTLKTNNNLIVLDDIILDYYNDVENIQLYKEVIYKHLHKQDTSEYSKTLIDKSISLYFAYLFKYSRNIFKFAGYVGNENVITTLKGYQLPVGLKLPNQVNIVNSDTYDIQKIVVVSLGDLNYPLRYEQSPIFVSASGNAKILSDKVQSFLNGQLVIYVASHNPFSNESGTVIINYRSHEYIVKVNNTFIGENIL